ncbi:BMP family ABC transporter substrate-binding protein, partial [Klebsiella pneumoniae]|nr:BMP family ABC transporter substrate-binding protein [Klebsiella pneumoniae]
KKFSKDKYDLSFGIGYKLEGATKEVAKESPKQQFAIVDTVVDAPNVTSITFKVHEGSFLVGAVAAMSTKTNKVGFV